MATIRSSVINEHDEGGISDLYVEAWKLNNNTNDLLGCAYTEGDGSFRITFDDDEYRDPSQPRFRIQIYFRVYQKHQLLINTEDDPVWYSLRGKIDPIVIDRRTSRETGETHRVSGRVAEPKGRGLSDLAIRVFHQTVHGEVYLTAGKTDANGDYIAYYRPVQPGMAGRRICGIVVKAFSSPREPDPLISSPLIFNPSDHEVINLVVGEEPYRGLDLYSKIHQSLMESLRGVAIDEIDLRGVYCLAHSNDLPVADVADYILARQWAREWEELPAEIYFGWFKLSFPRHWGGFLGRTIKELQDGIDTAVAENLIPEEAQEQKRGLATKIRRWRTEHIVTSDHQPLHKGTVGQLLDASRLNRRQRNELIDRWQTFEGTIDEFWTEQEKLLGRERFADLEFTLQLGGITRNHIPLINRIKRRRNLNQIYDLATLQENDWVRLVRGNQIEIPDDIPGETDSDKRREFAHRLQKMTEEMIPTAVLANALKEDNDIDSESFDRFFEQNQEFEFRQQTVRSYLRAHPKALSGIDQPEVFTRDLEAMQRVFHLTPSENKYAAAKILWQNHLHSAFSIRMAGEEALFPLFDGEREIAKKIYQKSVLKQNVSQAIRMLQNDGSGIEVRVMPKLQVVPNLGDEGVPDLETLFGDNGYCECAHCRSFFSPSAYLVDLFLFLNKASLLESLFHRRRDLGNIELGCENSHTPLPYIDLVNEVLESAISPIDYDDSETVYLFGKTITLQKAITPQTDQDTSTLKAYPQHLNPLVYDILLSGKENEPGVAYPWNLPFNLWMQEVRLLLKHLGVPRWQLMESILGGPADPKLVAREYLQLIPEESSIITDTSTSDTVLARYWGASPSELNQVPLFLKQSGFSYDELKELLQLRYIQTTDSNNTLVVAFDPPSSCKVADATIENLSNDALSRIHRFGRLWRKTSDSMIDLDRTITAFNADIIDSENQEEDFLSTLAGLYRVEEQIPQKIDRSEILSWWGLLDTHEYTKDNPSIYSHIISESHAE